MVGCIKGGILGGIILFIWGFLSWMVFPWHAMTLHEFKSDVAVAQAIQTNAPISGIYILPPMKQNEGVQNKVQVQEPMVFASVYLPGMPSTMTGAIGISLITQIVAAFLVACILTKTRTSYLGKVGLTVLFAIAAVLVRDIPAWNWFKFDTQYTLVMAADIIIGWFLAGLVLAKFTTK